MDTSTPSGLLTPSTSAFLAYLASTYDPQPSQIGNKATTTTTATTAVTNNSIDPRILPSTNYFNLPIPGRDTPENTPSSKDDSVSPPVQQQQNGRGDVKPPQLSEDSDDEGVAGGRRGSGHGVSKRKASRSQANHHRDEEHDDDEDSDSDSPDAHEDKKHEARKGGRKSKGEVDENGKPIKEMTKAQRRKEQNRAAQKAFRERREAKVRDLEEKVAELESKSYGVNVENENLRGILKRLQEENVALKQAAFTFSMPVASGSAAPAQSSSSGKEASLGTTRQPSPYQAEDPLRSINDPPARNDSLGSNASPEPLRSVNSPNLRAANASTDRSPSQPPQLFNGATNAFDSNFLSSYMGKPGSPSNSMKTSPPSVPASSQSGLTPQSTTSTKTEIEALWASFLDQQAQQRQQAQQPKTPGTLLKEQAYSMFGNGAFTGNGFVTSPKAFDAGNAGTGAAPSFDKMAFRDDSSGSAKSQPQAPVSVPAPQDGNRDPWAGMMDSSMKDFLASLTGANEESAEVPPTKSPEDEDFNAQLLKLLGAASPSAAFNLPVGTDNPFSPTNYLNMEPSPSASGSNGISPASMAQLSSVSNSASPGSSAGDAATSVTSFSQSQNGDGSHGLSAQKRQDSDGKEWVYIVDQSGNVIRPADMWTDLGFKKQDAMHEILVDDLCDLMKTKVTCKDGVKYIGQDDAKHVLELRDEYLRLQRQQGASV